MLLVSLLVSCGDDDNMGGSNELIGTWKATSNTADATTTTTFGDMTVVSTTAINCTELDFTLVFDSNTYISSGSYVQNSTITIDGSSTNFTTPVNETGTTGTYSVSGNQLTLDGTLIGGDGNSQVASTDGPQTATFSISNGVLTITSSAETTVSQPGSFSEVIANATSTWVKQ